MSVFDKAKNAVVKGYQTQQKKLADKKAEKELALAAENIRLEKISSGNITPIQTEVNLESYESAFLELTARRIASVESIVSATTGSSKKKHVVGRALVGGVLLGPVGMIGGAATAGSKNKSVTTQNVVNSLQAVDTGNLLFTNKRVLFIGNKQIVSLKYSEIVASSFNSNKITIRYPDMLPSEHYEVFGTDANNVDRYYQGITAKLQ